MGLYSNKSQMTSKCAKNKEVVREAQPSDVLPHYEVFCHLLLYRRPTAWNAFVLCNNKAKRCKWRFHLCVCSLLVQE